MGFAERRGDYYRARFKRPDGKYGTVKDDRGVTRRFNTRREAVQAANEEEVKVRSRTWRDPNAARKLTGAWANDWYGSLDLAPSTMQNIRRHLEEHILPEFEDWAIGDIEGADVDTWEKKERAAGYKPSSVKTWRGTLHTMLADAVEAGVIPANPATKRRGRGRRAGRKKDRGPEKPTIDDLGALLLAERAALLSGRDDEFVLLVLLYFTGVRWGEAIGLETKYARLKTIRIESQLYELDTGELIECPPKEDSYRDVDLPDWLSKLVATHIARTSPQPCDCHGKTYVFTGKAQKSRERRAVTLADVARRAKVSTGTVSNVLNRPDAVAEATRVRVEAAITDLGFVRGSTAREGAAHWRRSGFATWVFQPATTGWYPRKAPQMPRPVPVAGEPFPGVPVRGRNSQGRAEACWVPLVQGLTPHLLRHSHKTVMVEMRTPEVLSHERLGHELGGMGGRYAHVTAPMRQELCEALTERWEAALDARLELNPRSPVTVLDDLLRAQEEKKKGDDPKIISQNSPRGGVVPLRSRPQKGA